MKKTIIIASAVCALALNAGASTAISTETEATSFLNGNVYQDLNVTSDSSGSASVASKDFEWNSSAGNSFTLTATLKVSALSSLIGRGVTSGSLGMLLTLTGSNQTVGVVIGASDNGLHNGLQGGYIKTNGSWDWGSSYRFDDSGSTSNTKLHSLGSVDFSNVVAASFTFSYEDSVASRGFLTLVTESNGVQSTVTYYGTDSSLRWSGGIGSVQSIGYDAGLVTSVSLMQGDSTGNVALLNTAAIAAVAIPEPATATLSLLALAGLAARRRRK